MTGKDHLYVGEDVPEVFRRAARSHVWVAHNAEGFDALAWAILAPRDCQPAWVDSQPLCKAAGLPGRIDAIGKVLLGYGKQDDGSRVMRMLSTVKIGANGQPVYPVGTPALWAKLLEYNRRDVEILKAAFDIAWPKFQEPELLQLHSKINARGVKVDLGLVTKLTVLWKELKAEAADRIAELTGGALTAENLRSGPKVHQWLRAQGLHMTDANGKPTLRRDELQIMFDDPESFFAEDADAGLVIEVLRERIDALRVSDTKLARVLDYVDPDGRLRYLFQVYGAVTGRFSGRVVQPHNMARGHPDVDVERLLGNLTADAVRAEAERVGCTGAEVLSTLTRPIFLGPMSLVDFSSVEARGTAWLAGEEGLLRVFREDLDPYCVMASAIYGRPITRADKEQRQAGKITVLGCGYGMGANRFTAFARSANIDLASVGTSAEACVTTFRTTYPAIPALWAGLDKAAKQAVRYGRGEYRQIRFVADSSYLRMILPSGRSIWYFSPRLVRGVPNWAVLRGMTDFKTEQLVYTHPFGYAKTLYGGLLAENAVQAICRDLLTEAMLRLDAKGVPILLHVHDEIGADTLDSQLVVDTMVQVPEWAEGLPVGAEGKVVPYYTK